MGLLVVIFGEFSNCCYFFVDICIEYGEVHRLCTFHNRVCKQGRIQKMLVGDGGLRADTF